MGVAAAAGCVWSVVWGFDEGCCEGYNLQNCCESWSCSLAVTGNDGLLAASRHTAGLAARCGSCENVLFSCSFCCVTPLQCVDKSPKTPSFWHWHCRLPLLCHLHTHCCRRGLISSCSMCTELRVHKFTSSPSQRLPGSSLASGCPSHVCWVLVGPDCSQRAVRVL